MKYIYSLFVCILCFAVSLSKVQAQQQAIGGPGNTTDTVSLKPLDLREKAFANEKAWRITGAVSTISGEELRGVISSNFLNTLAAKIPGLTVISGSGEPGNDSPTLVIRGQSSWNNNTNSMLVYLDGFEVDLGTIASLSVEEVESVTVLKDASSLAAYGLKGANGALLVKTRRGIVSKPVITVNAMYGIQSPVQLPNVLNAFDYTTLYNQALQNDGLPAKYPDPSKYQAANDPLHPNVDWYKEILSPSAPIQNYNISFRGGSESVRYFVLVDNYNSSGLYKNAGEINKDFGTNLKLTKYNVRANVDVLLTKSLTISTEISGKLEDRNRPNGVNAADFFNSLMNTPASAFPVRNPDNTCGIGGKYDNNPEALVKQFGIFNEHRRTIQANFHFNQKLDAIVKGLSLNGGLSFSSQYNGIYSKAYTIPAYEILKDVNDNPVLDALGKNVYIQHGTNTASITDGDNGFWNRATYQLGLNYAQSFGQNTITGMLLGQTNEYSYQGLTFPIRDEGISGNVTYDFSRKYIVDFSFGYNGSRDYAAGHRFGFFQAIGAAWIMSDEDFMKNMSWLNYFKVKASYGLTGSRNDGLRFLFDQFGEWNTSWYFGTNSYYSGISEGRMPNMNASWEKKAMLNIGFESVLFKDLSVSLDLFNEKRSGILQIPGDIPQFGGLLLPYENIGKVTNHGFEAAIKYNGNVSPDFKINVGLNISYAKNKIDYMSEAPQPESYLYNTGYPVGQLRGLHMVGYYQTSDFDGSGNLLPGVVKSSYGIVKPGDIKYQDQNGDGVIDQLDVKPMKYNPIPEYTFGLNLGFIYKCFDLTLFFQAVTHRTVVLPSYLVIPFAGGNNVTQYTYDNWKKTSSPALTTLANQNNLQLSELYLLDAGFVKLRTIELGYTFSKLSFLNGKDPLRIFVNGTNLLTLDKISSLEAENLSMGYPLMKSVSFGLRARF